MTEAISTIKPSTYNPQIRSRYNTAKASTTDAQAAGYSASTSSVGKNATVEHRLNGLLDSNSDYIKRAKTKGTQYANSRGLLNTSMAAGASHGAAIDAATPIAAQDASTFNQRELENQNAINQAKKDSASFKQQANLSNAAAKNQASALNAEAENSLVKFNMNSMNEANRFNATSKDEADRFNASMKFDEWNADRDREQQEFMSRLDHANSMAQMSSEASANLKGEYVSSIDGIRKETVINISEIQNNANITAENKTAMIQQEIARRDADISATQSIYSSLPQWSQSWADFPSI